MRFIGSKINLLSHIEGEVNKFEGDFSYFCDLFAGTGAVGRYFKKNFSIISNDLLYFSYVLQKATIELNSVPKFNTLNNELNISPFLYFAQLEERNFHFTQPPFVFEQFSPSGSACRRYLTESNALRIDAIRQTIESWKQSDFITAGEYYYLLAGLIEAVPFVSNIAGTYGAFLKEWDKRAFKRLNLLELAIEDNGKVNKCFNQDANEIIKTLEGSILYIDPPYNQRQYSSNYHVLETVAKYDSPSLRGVTGLRQDNHGNSKYCRRNEVFAAFDALISDAKFDLVVVSYSNEGLMTEEEIVSSLETHGISKTLKVKRVPFRRYKRTSDKVDHRLHEQIFSIQK